MVPVAGLLSSSRYPAFAALVANGVRVTNAHVNSLPIAEFVMRSVLEEFQDVAERPCRRWSPPLADTRLGAEVSGSTWLIIGLGGIGTAVRRIEHKLSACG